MKLATVLDDVDSDVLERGRDYLLEGRILSLEQAENGEYNAVVKGYELYSVHLHMDDDGEIVELECDCPYDYGPICKHEVAVLLRLLGESSSPQPSEMKLELDESNGSNGSTRGTVRQTEADLQELLEAQAKGSLIDLLLSLASDFSLVEQQIRLFVYTADVGAEVEECREYIRAYIDAHADRGGYVSYRNIGQAVDGAYHIGERAQRALEAGEHVRSLLITFSILEEMLDLMERADDSSGSVGAVIDDALDRIYSISEAVQTLDPPDLGMVFQLLLQESELSKLEGWMDWRLVLIESAARLTTTSDRLSEWEQHVNRIVKRAEHNPWDRGYVDARIVEMRHALILQHEGELRAADYVQAHIHFPAMRNLAIRTAMEGARYDEVIQLAREGEEWAKSAGKRGLVQDWKKLRFEAYTRGGELENQRSLGLELVLEGDFAYYPLIKETYAASEWKAVSESLMPKFEVGEPQWSVYARILIDERDTNRLLAYVSREPSLVEQYHQHLVSEHLTEVIALFLTHIRKSAERANNRGGYRDVCRIIRTLYKVGGKNEARGIAQELLETYSRKPAFRDELMSLWV